MKQNLFDYKFYSFIFLWILLNSCSGNKTDLSKGKEKYIIPDSLLRTLQIEPVTMQPLVNSITLNGSVDFNQDNQVNIFPLVSGVIQDVKVQLGDYVSAGQVLAIVKSTEMAGYSNNLIQAETNLTAAKKQLDAQKDLFASGLASTLDVTAAQTNYDQAVAQLEMMKRILKINGNNAQGDYIIRSPISGFIVQKNISNNTAIRADNANNLFTISDLKEVWVQANIYEANIDKIHQGDSVQVKTLSYPDKIFYGRVDRMMNVLDPVNRVVKARVVLPNPGYALKPLMFANVIVSNKENRNVLTVPSSALVFDNSRYYVLVYKSASDVVITPVDVINTSGTETFIQSGIEEGQKIIASQALLIYDQLNS